MGFFDKIKQGLTKTRDNIKSKIDKVLVTFGKVDEELFEQLEEALISADLGVDASLFIIDSLRQKVKEEKITDPEKVKTALKEIILDILIQNKDNGQSDKKLGVILIIGVNGVGKTTSIGKIASIYKKSGKKVLLAAGDTFRAAAIDQLQVWADRAGVELIKQSEGSDPAAVVFDAVQSARSKKADVLICDTAGRLHTKKNLMEELKKIYRVIDRELPEAHKETLLVLDATTGQNAVSQAKVFGEGFPIDGIILTKLDGTAKGGIVIAIQKELGIPVKYVGVGEKIDDLQPFDAVEFAEALF